MMAKRVSLKTIPDAPECTCAGCRNACATKPGWMVPGDAERIAAHLGLPLPELFRTKLAVDWWEADEDAPLTFVLAPAIKGEATGAEYPGNPQGRCVFFKNERCSIHAVKPWECRKAGHVGENAAKGYHPAARDAWRAKKHQTQIRRLLGREPVTVEYHGSIFDMLLGALS